MMLSYIDDENDFIEKHNAIRLKAETMFSLVKRTIVYWLRGRKRRTQRKETYSYIIVYNVIKAMVNPLRLI
jgi:hypothetical protein